MTTTFPFARTCRQFILILSLLITAEKIAAQPTAGITVDGIPRTQGDTLRICKGTTLTYTSSAINYTAIRWRFNLGSPNSSALPGPTAVVYNTLGTDSTVQLVSNGTDTVSMFIIIRVTDVKPVVSFSHNTDVCSGTPQQFNPTVIGTAPFSFAWSFGGGGNSTASNPVHTFISLGCGSVNLSNSLTVTDATGCATTLSKPITILQAPDVRVQDPDPIPFSNCENSPTPTNPNFVLTLNNTSPSSSCIVSYTLDWGDGTVVSNPAFPATHTYTQIGAFNLVVTAVGQNGCTNSKTYVVANQTNPAGSLGTLGTTTNLCAPAVVPFTISNWQINSPGTIYQLAFGDGTSLTLTHPLNAGLTTDTVYHTYTETSCPGSSFIATLTVLNACGSTPYTAGGIQVLKKAESAFTVNANAFCVGQSVCFNNTTEAGFGPSCMNVGVTTWDFGDGSPVSHDYSPCHTYTSPGTYTVTLTTSNYCGPSTITRQVCITSPPVPGFTLNNMSGCMPLSVAATNTTVSLNNCTIASYRWTITYAGDFCGTASSWNFTNGSTETSANPGFVFNEAGSYTITLAVTNPCGVFTTSKVVQVKQAPKVTIAPIADHCGPVSFIPSATVTSCGLSPLAYNWTFGGGNPATSSSLNPGSILFESAGIHQLSLSATNECGTGTGTRDFKIDTVSLSVAGASQNLCGSSTTLSATPPVIGTGQWSFVSGPGGAVITTPSSPSTTVTGLTAGVYTFKWTITNGTCSSSSTVSVTIQSGPTPANAGPDQSLCLANSITLAANTPVIGTGQWSLVSGPAGSAFADAGLPGTTVSGLSTGIYIFRWTTSFSNCTPSTDDVQVTITANPSIALAGDDQDICSAATSLAATAPSIGVGQWSLVSGPGAPAFSNNALATTTVSGLVAGTYILCWTVSNGLCFPNRDTVQIRVSAIPTTPLAGNDQALCDVNTVTLAANTASTGSGVWTIVSGPTGATITNNTSASTTVTGMMPGVYVFRWTISNGSCAALSDDVQVSISEAVSVAEAGPSQQLCGNVVTMAGNSPVTGLGSWAFVSGPPGSSITNPSSPTTTITGLVPGTYVFKWTIANQSCSTNDVVTITIYPGPTPANAGTDQSLCLSNSTTLAANNPVIGTGAWSLVSGPAGSTIVDPTSPNTLVTGLIPGNYIFRWTTTFANCTPSIDEVQVSVFANPTIAAAGTDQVICASAATMSGNTPTIGSGTWTFVSGPAGSSIQSPSSPTTSIAGLTPGVYVFQWTVTNGACAASIDLVQVTVTALPTIANAGPDQVLCNEPTTTFAANAPTTGLGLWTYVDGPPGSAITNPNLPATTVTSLIPGIYHYQWTISNGVCPSSNDDVQITVLADLQAQISAPVTTLCAGQTATVNASTPSGGTGTYVYQWQQSADGVNWSNIPLATAPTYSSQLFDTVYIRCVIRSLPCEMITNEVFIAVQPPVTNNTIADNQVICINTDAAPFIGATPTGGDGQFTFQWEQSPDGVNWATIPGATNIGYDPPVLTATTYYRRLAFTNLCTGPQANASNVVIVTVKQDSKALFAGNPTLSCAPFNLASAITVSTFPDRNGNYSWYANGSFIGSNSAGIFPGYTIVSPGQSVTIKLVTGSQFGCKPDSQELVFSTVITAVADFTKIPAAGCGPLAVTFTNTSSVLDNSIQYFWDFGNGVASNLVQPGTISFANSPDFIDTTYYVTLKAFNGCDTTYKRDSITVYPNSKARFSVDTTRGCSPFTIHLNNTSAGNNTAYYWDFGDGHLDTTYANGAFTHTYNTSVISTYVLQLISENQCTRDTQSMTLIVSPNSIEAFVAVNGNQLTGCAPHLVAFNNSSVGAAQLTWNFGDNSGAVITPNNQSVVQHTYFAAGNYTVSIRLQNDCSDTTIYRSVTVYGAPVANFSVTPQKVCLNQPVAVHNTSIDANAYEWFWGDGSGMSTFEGSHSYSSAGVYEIMLVAKKVNPGGVICSDTLKRTVTVVEKIPAQITVAAGKHCAPYTLHVNAGNISGFSNVRWIVYDSSSTPGQFEMTGLSATHVYDVAGTYSVKLIVYTTPDGCADSATYEFQVFNTPQTSIQPQLIRTCSHDTTLTYTATTTAAGGDPVSYSWFINGSIEGSNNPFTYRFETPLNNSSPVVYNIQALAQNSAGCGDTSLASQLIVQPLPWPKIVVSPSLVIQQPDYAFTFEDTVASNPNKTYVWNFGDASLQTREGQKVTYEYADTGSYTVKLRVTDFATGCSATDSTKVTILYIPGFLYVPNAMCMGCSNFGLRQFLPLGKGLKKYRLQIYNAWGQKIFETTSLDANGAPNQPWDGILKNQPLQQDTYTWQIEATYINDTEWKGMLFPGSNKPVKSGFITIIK